MKIGLTTYTLDRVVITRDGKRKNVNALAVDPADSRKLYACTFRKEVYKSVDGGKPWVQKNKGIGGKEPFACRIWKREKDGVLFLVVCRRSEDGSIGNDQDGAVYRSDNGAES